jgi:hypothetical protein
MKIKTPEEILEYFEKESSDRLMDHIEYNERVIIPAMKAYHAQFELSDEEIESNMRKRYRTGFYILSETSINDMVSGAIWYRDELKRKKNEVNSEKLNPCGFEGCENPHERVYRGCDECKFNKIKQ